MDLLEFGFFLALFGWIRASYLLVKDLRIYRRGGIRPTHRPKYRRLLWVMLFAWSALGGMAIAFGQAAFR